MAKRDNLKTSTSVIIDLPAEKIDLADWIVHFSNEDYVACTPATGAHKVMYVYRGGDGRWVFRNDETAAGFMMTQLYREEIMQPQHIFLVSPRTKGRLLGIVPLTLQITWDMKVEPIDKNSCKFTCTVGARLNPSPVYRELVHSPVVLDRSTYPRGDASLCGKCRPLGNTKRLRTA